MALRGWATAAGALLMVAACGSAPADEAVDEAYEEAADGLSESSFEEVRDTGACTEDCSGHEAGFEWAREQGVTDSSECSGDSQSFREGCEAYAVALEEAAAEELEEGE